MNYLWFGLNMNYLRFDLYMNYFCFGLYIYGFKYLEEVLWLVVKLW